MRPALQSFAKALPVHGPAEVARHGLPAPRHTALSPHLDVEQVVRIIQIDGDPQLPNPGHKASQQGVTGQGLRQDPLPQQQGLQRQTLQQIEWQMLAVIEQQRKLAPRQTGLQHQREAIGIAEQVVTTVDQQGQFGWGARLLRQPILASQRLGKPVTASQTG